MKRVLYLIVGGGCLLSNTVSIAGKKAKVAPVANVTAAVVSNSSAPATASQVDSSQSALVGQGQSTSTTLNASANNKPAAAATGSNLAAISDDTVLLTMDHKPVLTVKDFTNFVNEIAQADQYIAIMLQADPARVQANLYEAKVRGLLIGEWAQKDGIRNSAKYKAEEQELLERVRMMLDNQAFIREHAVEVTDADLRKYYDEHKATDPALLLTPAGIEAKAVRFGKEQVKAEEFAAQLKKAKKSDFEVLAKQANLEVLPLGVINDKTYGVMPEIQTAVLAAQHFPAVSVVKCEDDYWVVLATGKVAAKYQPFEQVKAMIKEQLYPEKVKAMFDAEIPKLMQRFKVVEHKQYFVDLQAAAAVDSVDEAADALLDCEDLELAPANSGATELSVGDLELELLDSDDEQAD